MQCTVRPSEAPERLGLRALRSRGYRGRKQREVGWSKTMVRPLSAPSQVQLGRGARTGERVCAVKSKNAGIGPPSASEPGMIGSGRWEKGRYALRGEKNRQVSGPRALQAESGRVGALERSVVLFTGKKRHNCSMFQVLVRVLPSESFSLKVPGRMTSAMV